MGIQFIALGVPVGILIFSLRPGQQHKAVRIAGTLLGLVMLLAVGFFLLGPKLLSGDAWYERSPWKEGLLLLTMLSGMAARSLDQAIEIRSQRIAKLRAAGKLRRKPKLPLDPWDFSRPFLVALPTFGGLLGQIGDQAMGWVLVVLAFQTGFFWQTVLKKSEPES